MPPKHNSGATTSTKTTTIVRAKKRKIVDRSDEELDSDFDYTHNTELPQQNGPKSKTGRPGRQKQQRPTAPSHSSSNKPPSTMLADGKESWRTELSELKRTKQFAEEDRGFVFTRKKTVDTLQKSSTTSLPSKNSGFSAGGFKDAENPFLSASDPPLTPEGTPSRHWTFDNQVPAITAQTARAPKPTVDHQHTPVRNQESIVTIPMRETPTINRNKDLRNTNSRRSSLNMRGKRASSIGNGFAAVPHPSVDPKSFFRHIVADGPPPVRMKQLMAWCARKCIDSQRSNSQNALKIAKLIEEEALALLIAGKFSVSWYNRPQDREPIRVVPKKPHQQNVENMIKLKECEVQVAKLRKEDAEWTKLISSFNTFHATLLDSGTALPPGDEGIVVAESFADNIDIELLSADERGLWEKHCKQKDSVETGSTPKTPAETSDSTTKAAKDNKKWMKEMMSSLEKEVDKLQDTLYLASRFDKIAKQYTDQVLEQIAIALDERQRPPSLDNPFSLVSSSSSTASTSVGKGTAASKSVPTSAALSPGSIPT
ncbi:hypothetical protein BGZ65_010975 [Modicella reniformis]|uniref:Kinetochore protein mis13 n=1 Tax=Modicella reniformis TaxID=1440133 RepID=A0A9P6INV3_9FUNG|nr:hypothetical protein BGZ65_010975 [Modicella reniformis]